jgi:hypothetical protein
MPVMTTRRLMASSMKGERNPKLEIRSKPEVQNLSQKGSEMKLEF